ncbi:MAG: hypothetical protein HY921_08655 [Elusimicrobia bacterium]|nr:hypothetical protein [Elusimicrobiota bacterium]
MSSQEPRSSFGAGVLAALAIAGSALGALIFQHLQNRQAGLDKTGFDISETSQAPRRAASSSASATPAQSGLGMVKTGMPGFSLGLKAPPPAARKAAASVTELARANESRIRGLAMAYTKRYLVIAQYGRDWMSHPDLKKLNDDYMKDHDPVKFMRGLASSRNFGAMVKKYATKPEVQAFTRDAIKNAPGQLISAASEFLNEDKVVKKLVDNVAQSLGLPTGLFSWGGGDSEPKVDEKAVMNSVMQGNPDLQKALGNPEVQKRLQNTSR